LGHDSGFQEYAGTDDGADNKRDGLAKTKALLEFSSHALLDPEAAGEVAGDEVMVPARVERVALGNGWIRVQPVNLGHAVDRDGVALPHRDSLVQGCPVIASRTIGNTA
jgi:hypothetical protein